MKNNSLKLVDHANLKTNQLMIILLSILAFVFNLPWLAFVVGLLMLSGTLVGKPGFGFLYTYILQPTGIVKPVFLQDHPEPHRFAQGLGSIFLLSGSLMITIGPASLGWALVWIVVALAALNLFAGFCVGCAVYYWFNRLGLPGFSKKPPQGTLPGKRPEMSAENG